MPTTAGIADALSANPSEDALLAQLKDQALSAVAIEDIARNAEALKSRKVCFAVAAHAHTPRRIALRLLREMQTFDLMNYAMFPVAPADLKRVAEETLASRATSIPLGQRISLARRGSSAIAGALLKDPDWRVWTVALENPRLTEIFVVKAVRVATSPAFVAEVARHPRWSVRAEVQVALLLNEHTPLRDALDFARRLPPNQLKDFLDASTLPERIKTHLQAERNSDEKA